MRYINLEYHPHDSRIKIDDKDVCQTLNQRMGTGGGNVPLVLGIYVKTKRAQHKDDNETWVEKDIANTINGFDIGDVRATTVIVNETTDSIGIKSESRNDNG